MGDNPPNDILPYNRDMLDSRGLHLTNLSPGQPLALSSDQLVGLGVPYVAASLEPQDLIRLKNQQGLAPLKDNSIAAVEIIEQVFRGHTQGTQQHRDMKFPSPVDADVQDISRIKFKIEPGTTVWNHPSRVEELAACMGLSLVVL